MLPDLSAMRRRLCTGPLDALTAPVEAAILYRCVSGPDTTGGRPATTPRTGARERLTSFDTRVAADRFAESLRHAAGAGAWVQTRQLGIRHRHETHFVGYPDPDRPSVADVVSAGWRTAKSVLTSCSTPATDAGPRVAVAMWRALLLASTPVRNTAGLRLRVRDPQLLALAVRAAWTLGVHPHSRSQPNLGVLCVDDPDQVGQLLARLTPRTATARHVVAARARAVTRAGAGSRTAPRGARR